MIRQLLIPVVYNSQLLAHKDSPLDVVVLRAAHRALLRHQNGITDAFLFVLCGELTLEEADVAIANYGFPDVSVIFINTKDDDGDKLDDENVREQIGSAISQWLDKHHPAALTSLSPDGYDGLDMWWSGIESTEEEWAFTEEYAATLPETHRKKANTLLAILKKALDLDDPADWLDENNFALFAAALCEWLHGFEAASGNSNNNFDANDVNYALKIDDFFLGFLFCPEVVSPDLRYLLDSCDGDIAELKASAFKIVITEERTKVRKSLSKYFGNDTALFWTLYSAIWPQFNEPSVDLCNALVNSSAWEDMADVNDAWEFVTNGWTDSADA